MDSQSLWLTIPLAIALAACAGLRAWMPLLLAGVVARMGWLQLGSSFTFLSDNKALILFSIATAVEVAGDKFPAVDHVLDTVGTVLRPAAGTLLAASVLGSVQEPLLALCLGLAIGAPAAALPHAVKSGVRALSSTFTFGLANPVLSVIEDAATVVLFVLAVLVPLVAVMLFAIVGLLVLRRLRRRPAQPTRA
jgi:hypothetical protein